MSVEEKRSAPAAFNRYMRQIRSQIIATGALILAPVSQADATAEHHYKPGEFLIVDGGTSPDKKFSIVAGDNKAGEFGVYLRDAHTKKLIGQLEEVATALDTTPDAYHAHWSSESKHFGVSSRADRHLTRNVIYRIENRFAYAVETPQLLCYAVSTFAGCNRSLVAQLLWIARITMTSHGRCDRTRIIPKS